MTALFLLTRNREKAKREAISTHGRTYDDKYDEYGEKKGILSKYDGVKDDQGFRISGNQKEDRKRPSRRRKAAEGDEEDDDDDDNDGERGRGKAATDSAADKTGEEAEEMKKRRREEIGEKLRKDKDQNSKRQALSGFKIESAKLVSDTKTQEEASRVKAHGSMLNRTQTRDSYLL